MNGHKTGTEEPPGNENGIYIWSKIEESLLGPKTQIIGSVPLWHILKMMCYVSNGTLNSTCSLIP